MNIERRTLNAKDSTRTRDSIRWRIFFSARSWRVRGWLFFLLMFSLPARAEAPREYQIKAAFLYNFAKFVEWPAQRFADLNAPLVIGVFGKNPFGGDLENVVKGRKINNRDIVVKHVENVEEARDTHILFFGAAEDNRAAKVLDALHGAGVLTIGETDTFSSHAGMIQFLLEGDKVHFQINVDSAGESGLKISAQLLKLATSVRKKK